MSICHPTKEQIENDYFNLNLNHQQIAEKYKFKTRQVIHRLFKKYDIKSRTKKELSEIKFSLRVVKPSKDELELLYHSNSILKISKILNVSRNVVSRWIDEYGIEKTYFKNNIDNEVLKKELQIYSVKELCVKYKVDPNEIKRRVKNIPEKTYTLYELKKIFSLYDIHSKYFARQICNDDPNVYQSIIELSEGHFLQSDKITEKIYRLLNNIAPDHISICKKCSISLKFYTLESGYGNSEHKICHNCITSLGGSSKPSQELFWNLYQQIGNPNNCNFSELNNEKTIYINNKDKMFFNNHKKLNKNRYHIDFMLENKIIEYNGEYWHQDKEREIIKNNFLKRKGFKVLHIMDSDYKKDPQKVIRKCIKFLVR